MMEKHPLGSQIAEGNVVGWFQGKMEFGPRALGNRSFVHPQMVICKLR